MMKFWMMLFSLLASVVLAWATPQTLQKFENCRLSAASWADGDSFGVEIEPGRQVVLRLYYVDANEVSATNATDQRRVRDQSSYFGVGDHRITMEYGKKATERTQELLSEPFTVHTAFARAPGRSAKPRIYGFVTLADGRDLGELLVSEGLARSYGVRRSTPDGRSSGEAKLMLDDMELGAAMERRGIWGHSQPERLVAMRAARRAESRQLEQEFGLEPGKLLDPNVASVDELMLVPGIGSVLAERIVEGRPYSDLEDLRRVPGIGSKTMVRLKERLTVDGGGDPPNSN